VAALAALRALHAHLRALVSLEAGVAGLPPERWAHPEAAWAEMDRRT